MGEMYRKISIISLIVLFVLTINPVFGKKVKTTIKIYETGGKTEVAATKANVDAFMTQNPDINVKIITGPPGTDNIIGFFLQLFESKSGDIDVLTVDSAWAKSLSANLIDLNKYISKKQKEGYFKSTLASYLVDGKLVAVPFISDVGILYYRTDLLKKYDIKVPETWLELTKAAYTIQKNERESGNNDFVGYVWQGYAYEGLTCNALEWVYNYDGGTIINDNKEITVNNPNTVKALTMAAQWVGTISPKGVLTMRENETKNVFMSGNAAFARSWPYLYAICDVKGSAVKGKIGVAEIPKGSKGIHAGALGGWGLAVNKYSKNKEAAAKLAIYIGSKESQKRRAEIVGQAPNIISLYQGNQLPKNNPVFNILEKALQAGINRPYVQSYPYYNQVSQEFYKTVYKILAKEKTPYAGVKELENKLKNITGFKIK
jgi:trehalose/maltose transport system substrate-binding protein